MKRFVLAAALASGCGADAPPSGFEAIASAVNPPLHRLRAHTAMMFAVGSERATLAASICVDAKEPLSALAATRYLQFPQTPTTINVRIGEYAAMVLEEFSRTCAQNMRGEFANAGGCSERCRSGWRLMVDEVEKARALAARESVEILSLSPTWGGTAQP